MYAVMHTHIESHIEYMFNILHVRVIKMSMYAYVHV